MTIITTGNFQQESAARQAMSDLVRAGFESGIEGAHCIHAELSVTK